MYNNSSSIFLLLIFFIYHLSALDQTSEIDNWYLQGPEKAVFPLKATFTKQFPVILGMIIAPLFVIPILSFLFWISFAPIA